MEINKRVTYKNIKVTIKEKKPILNNKAKVKPKSFIKTHFQTIMTAILIFLLLNIRLKINSMSSETKM
jgi:hypothetical protein